MLLLSRSAHAGGRPAAARACRRLPSPLRTAAGRREPPQGSGDLLDPAARALAAATVLGLTGTVAVVGAQLSGINMFAKVSWSPADFQTAFLALAPVTLLEALVLGVDHKVPAEFLQQAEAGGTGASSSSSSSGGGSGASRPLLDVDAVLQAGWSPGVLQVTLAMYRDVLLGVLGSPDNLPPLPLQYEVSLMLAREASKEVLQRGFLLTALAGWLTDRLYEGGVDDLVQLESLVRGSLTGETLTVPLLGSWLSAWLVASAFSPAAVAVAQQNMLQVCTGVLVAAGIRADGSGAQASSSASSSSGGGGVGSSSSGGGRQATGGSSTTSTATAASSSSSGPGPQKEIVVIEDDPSTSTSTSTSTSAAESQRMLEEYTAITKAEQVATSPVATSTYWISLVRQLMRFVAANSAFVVTGGNLAATFAAGAVSGLLVVFHGRLARSRAGVARD